MPATTIRLRVGGAAVYDGHRCLGRVVRCDDGAFTAWRVPATPGPLLFVGHASLRRDAIDLVTGAATHDRNVGRGRVRLHQQPKENQ